MIIGGCYNIMLPVVYLTFKWNYHSFMFQGLLTKGKYHMRKAEKDRFCFLSSTCLLMKRIRACIHLQLRLWTSKTLVTKVPYFRASMNLHCMDCTQAVRALTHGARPAAYLACPGLILASKQYLLLLRVVVLPFIPALCFKIGSALLQSH